MFLSKMHEVASNCARTKVKSLRNVFELEVLA